MTSKKRRNRGSRTHGGGSHKNRRGAGHRGGRGKAGSRKHEMHHYGPWAKHGFTQPEEAQDDVAEVRVQKIDEDAALLAAEGVAENDDGAYTIDARDVAEDGWEADVVKVLGNGQVRNELDVVADDFTDSARELIESAGGEATLTEHGEQRQAEMEADTSTDEEQEGAA